MQNDKIKNILESNVFLGEGYICNIVKILQEIYLNKKYLIITDKNIFAKLSLESSNIRILPFDIKAKYEYSLELSREIKKYDFVVAIGSGTINDLVKFASYKADIPYVVFATAPSMNGYLSANASLLKDGIKQSFAAHLPEYAFFDLDILVKAPKRLIQSGIGDSVCSSTCRADWLLSHYLLGSEYKEEYFENTREYEKELFSDIVDIFTNKDKIKLLTKILIYSGINMTRAGGSYPASQGEHMIAHLMESISDEFKEKYHGEQIAVTTYYMAKLQELFLDKEKIVLEKKDITNEILQSKPIENANLQNWQRVKEEIQKHFLSSEKIADIFSKLDISYKANDLVNFAESCKKAFLTRDRFTFLDLDFYKKS